MERRVWQSFLWPSQAKKRDKGVVGRAQWWCAHNKAKDTAERTSGTWNLEPEHQVTVPPIAFNQTQTLSSIIRQRFALDPMTD